MLKFIVLVVSFFLSQNIFANSLHLVINGKAIHERAGNLNERNWGLGFEYNFAEDGKWINFINAGFFKDSLFNISKHIGGGSKRRFLLTSNKEGWHIDAGWNAFLMTRKDHRNNQPFFAALPFVSLGTSKLAINTTFIPAVNPKYEKLWFFQATMEVAKW